MITSRQILPVILVFTLLGIMLPCQGSVVFSQLYDDGTYEPSSSFVITGESASMNDISVGYFSHAALFTVEYDTILSSIDLALSYYSHSASPEIKVSIRFSTPLLDLPATSPMASGFLTAIPNGSSSSILTSFIPDGNPITLLAGQTYWVTAEPTDSSTFNGWNLIENNIFVINPLPYPDRYRLAVSYDGIEYVERLSGSLPAFRVTGTPIPEPASSSVYLAWISIITLFRRRNLKAASR